MVQQTFHEIQNHFGHILPAASCGFTGWACRASTPDVASSYFCSSDSTCARCEQNQKQNTTICLQKSWSHKIVWHDRTDTTAKLSRFRFVCGCRVGVGAFCRESEISCCDVNSDEQTQFFCWHLLVNYEWTLLDSSSTEQLAMIKTNAVAFKKSVRTISNEKQQWECVTWLLFK